MKKTTITLFLLICTISHAQKYGNLKTQDVERAKEVMNKYDFRTPKTTTDSAKSLRNREAQLKDRRNITIKKDSISKS